MAFILSCQTGPRAQLLEELERHFAGQGADAVDAYRDNVDSLLGDAAIDNTPANRRCVERLMELVRADKLCEAALLDKPLDPQGDSRPLSGRSVDDLTAAVCSLKKRLSRCVDAIKAMGALCDVATVAWPVLLTVALLVSSVATPCWVAFGCTLGLAVALWTAGMAVALLRHYNGEAMARCRHELCVLNVHEPVSKQEQLFALFCDRVLPAYKSLPDILNGTRVRVLFNDWKEYVKGSA